MKPTDQTRLCLAAAIIFGYFSMFYSYGPIAGAAGDRTGSPLNSGLTCSNGTGCHTSLGAYTPTVTVQLINGSNVAVTSYTPTNTYTVRITMTTTTGSNPKYGFQILAVTSGSPYSNVNAWGTPLPSGTNFKTLGGRTYVEQYSTLSTSIVNLPWTAPASSTGNITFYCAGNIVNNNGQESGDNCATTSLTITPAGSGCVAPSLATSVTNVTCKGGSNGSVMLNTTGGTSPFVFAWTGPGNFNASTQNISGTKAGNYMVVVTATGGCTDTAYATITEPAIATKATITSNSPLCVGSSLNLNGSGTGAPSLIYSWSGPGSVSSNSQNLSLNSVTTAMSGDYILTVQDGIGCIGKDTESVVINDVPSVDSINDSMITVYAHKFSMVHPQYVQTFKWEFGDGVVDSMASSPIHAYGPGTYNVRLIVKNNCGSDTVYKTVFIPSGIAQYLSEQLTIAPNPASSFVMIKTQRMDMEKHIIMYNIHGVKVYEIDTRKKDILIHTSEFVRGMYFINMTMADKTIYRRVEIK